MSSGKKAVVSGAVAAVIAIALVAAAMYTPGLISKSNISETTSQTLAGSGTVGIQLTDPPTVPPGVTDVYIDYSAMGVHVADAGNDSGWYQIAPSGEIDLMTILNTSITLGSSQVSAGVFNAVGFNITRAIVTVNGANESAFISSNKLIVPLVGGLHVAGGSDQGILVDLSPTVLAVQNGSETAYVLIPSAHTLYLPAEAWVHSEQRGDIIHDIQQNTWFHDMGEGHISVVHGAISAGSMNVTVVNNGANSTVISSLTLYYPLAVLCQQYSGACTAAVGDDMPTSIPVALFGVLSNGSLIQYNFTAGAESHYHSGVGSDGAVLSTSSTEMGSTSGDGTSTTTNVSTSSSIGDSNETSSSSSTGDASTMSATTSLSGDGDNSNLATVNAGAELEIAEAQGINLGFVLAPGQSVTFTFRGPMVTITPNILDYIHLSVAVPQSLVNAVSNINSGQQYYIVARGPFDTFGYDLVTAS